MLMSMCVSLCVHACYGEGDLAGWYCYYDAARMKAHILALAGMLLLSFEVL